MKSLKILSIIMFCVMLKITAQTHYTVISNSDPVSPTNPPAGTLRWAIEQANSNPGLDYIDFNIALSPPHIIQLASVLPVITDPIIIDGNTQPDNGTSGLYYKIAIKGDITPGNITYIFSLDKNQPWDPIITDASTSEIRNLKIYETDSYGILLSCVEKVKIIHNIIHSSNGYGIRFSGAGKSVMQGNIIGTDNTFNLASYYSVKDGNLINTNNSFQGDSNLIGGLNVGEPNYFYNANLLSYNSAINISIGNYNKISGNVFINNSQNINLISKGCQGNMCHQPPVYQATYLNGTTTASGTSGNNDFIELFKTNSGGIDAIQFLGSTTANSAGQWNVGLTGLNVGDTIIATATDEQGNTSSFSTGIIITTYVQPCCTDLSFKFESGSSSGWCSGQSFNLSTSCGDLDYIWDFGDGNIINTSGVHNASHVYATAGTYSVTVTTNSTANCPAITSTEVYTIPDCQPPCCSDLSINAKSEQVNENGLPCLGNTIYLYASCGVQDYNWDFGDGNVLSTTGVDYVPYTYTVAGSYTLTISTNSTANCPAITHTQVINIGDCSPCCNNLSLTLMPGGDGPLPNICVGEGVNIYALSGCPGLNYNWNVGNGTILTTGTNSISCLFNTPKSYGVTLTVSSSDSSCLPTRASIKVVVNDCQPPCCSDLSINAKVEQVNENGLPCLGNAINLYASCGVQDYNWDFGDGNVLSTTGVDYVPHTYTVAGSYTLTISTNSTANCPAITHTQVINIGDCRPPCCSNFELSLRPGEDDPLPNLCASDSLLIYLYARCEGVTYSFDFGDGTSSTISNIWGGSSIKHLYSSPGTYSIIVTASRLNNNCIPSIDTLVVTIQDCQTPCCSNFHIGLRKGGDGPLPNLCGSDSIPIYVFSACEGMMYNFDFGDGTSADFSNFYGGSVIKHLYLSPNTYSIIVTATATDSSCIPTSYTLVVTIKNCNPCIPTSTLSVVSSTVCLNQNVCYVSEPRVCDPGSPNFAWDFGDGTPVLNSCGWCHTYTASGTYSLALTVSGSQCITSTVSQQINVVSCDPPPPPPCIDCIGSFAPNPDKTYIISAWVKEGNAPLTKTSYTYPNIIVGCPSVAFISVAFTSSGAIIDGWQRIEGEFTIPALAKDISIDLNCTSPSGDCYFDDIRVFPTDGSMKSYVYDPVNMRLVAELDERNYATLYEYDEEGKLVRVKKETEKGIMTIKENRNNSSK